MMSALDLLHVLIVEPRPLHRAWPDIVEDDVALADQFAEIAACPPGDFMLT